MFLRDIYNKNEQVISFEVFPPNKNYNLEELFTTIKELKSLNPGYVSVTYGAGGGTRDRTVEIASKIINELKLQSVAHLTCVNTTKDNLKKILDLLKENNIQNILALRGDPPVGQTNYTKEIGGFNYAFQLVEFIKKNYDWSIAVAGYPQGHQENKNLDEDINYLKMKVDSGADVIITQLFFDNDYFYKFRDIALKKGINVPIVPGILPILNFNAINKIISLSNATIPDGLLKKLEKHQNTKEDIEKIGIEYAIEQANDLLKNMVPGLHFYTMNKSKQTIEIVNALNKGILLK